MYRSKSLRCLPVRDPCIISAWRSINENQLQPAATNPTMQSHTKKNFQHYTAICLSQRIWTFWTPHQPPAMIVRGISVSCVGARDRHVLTSAMARPCPLGRLWAKAGGQQNGRHKPSKDHVPIGRPQKPESKLHQQPIAWKHALH